MLYVSFILFLILTPTGLYTEYAGSHYLATLILLFTIIIDGKSRSSLLAIVTTATMKKKLLGSIIVSVFLAGTMILANVDLRFVVVPVVAIQLYCLTFIATIIVLKLSRGDTVVVIGAFLALCVILAAQVLVMNGYVTAAIENYSDYRLANLRRTGGFFNANQTGLIAQSLLLAIALIAAKSRSKSTLLIPAYALTLIILIITQSRANILFFAIFSIFLVSVLLKSTKLSVVLYISIALITLILTNSNLTEELLFRLNLESFLARLYGTSVDDGRFSMIQLGWDAFLRNPFFGNGHHYLENNYGIGAHNQIIDSLSSYGMFGTLIILFGCILLYGGQPAIIYMFAVAQAILFTHNFFDQNSIQITLGLVIGVSARYRFRRN